MKSRSVLDRIASFQPRPRACFSEAGTSGKGRQDGSERASASSSPAGAPSSRIASVSTPRYKRVPSASSCGSSS